MRTRRWCFRRRILARWRRQRSPTFTRREPELLSGNRRGRGRVGHDSAVRAPVRSGEPCRRRPRSLLDRRSGAFARARARYQGLLPQRLPCEGCRSGTAAARQPELSSSLARRRRAGQSTGGRRDESHLVPLHRVRRRRRGAFRRAQPKARAGIPDYCGLPPTRTKLLRGWGPAKTPRPSSAARLAGSRGDARDADRCCVDVAARRNGLTPESVDWLLPIQTHAGLLDQLSRALERPTEKVPGAATSTRFSGRRQRSHRAWPRSCRSVE